MDTLCILRSLGELRKREKVDFARFFSAGFGGGVCLNKRTGVDLPVPASVAIRNERPMQ